MDRLLRDGHTFFELPDATKEKIHISNSMDRVRGYQKKGENVTYGKRDQQEVQLSARSSSSFLACFPDIFWY
jgi:isopenicillin N synthase-like dioxygenase